MSKLILILPSWILGILAGWYAPIIFEIRPGLLILPWLILFGAFLFASRNFKKALPPGSSIVLLLVFQTSFLISFLKSGGNEIETDSDIEIVGKVVKVWKGANSERLKIRVVRWTNVEGEYVSSERFLLLAGKNKCGLVESGDIIRVKVRLELIPKKVESGDFPERMYWAAEGIRKKGWIRSIKVIRSNEQRFRLLTYSAGIQNKLCSLIDDSFEDNNKGAVLKAMILGQKDNLPIEIKDVFRSTGISHLLAVSGLHVGLVYIIIIRLLFFFKGRRTKRIAEVAALIAVWAYSFMTGFGPSVQRAAGMISLFAISRLFDRHVKPLQILVLSFLIQTALNPFALFSFGFQLSYLAVSGIFMFHPQWQRILKTPKPAIKKLWDFSGVSISAQAFTFPFILIYFQEFPSYFLFGNLLLVPIGLLVFYVGVMYIPIMVLGINFNFPAWLLDRLISLMLFLSELLAGFPLAVISFKSFSILHVIFYFLIAGVLFSSAGISIYKKLVFVILSLLIVSAMAVLINIY